MKKDVWELREEAEKAQQKADEAIEDLLDSCLDWAEIIMEIAAHCEVDIPILIARGERIYFNKENRISSIQNYITRTVRHGKPRQRRQLNKDIYKITKKIYKKAVKKQKAEQPDFSNFFNECDTL